VGLESDRHTLRLTVSDDGCGVDLRQVDLEGRHGLQGMQERAAATGGRLSVESDPGGGTTVRFSLEMQGD
jgi:signal transduction histidine kinase